MIISPSPTQVDSKDQTEIRKALSDLTQSVNNELNNLNVETIILNSGAASTYNMLLSIFRPVKYKKYILYNIGVGQYTIVYDSLGVNPLLSNGCTAEFIYNGTSWDIASCVMGSNINGLWEKHPDGKMIQWGAISNASRVFSAFGSLGISPAITITFPISFVDTTYTLNPFPISTSNAALWCGQNTGIAAGTMDVYILYVTTATLTCGLKWSAVGNWKA